MRKLLTGLLLLLALDGMAQHPVSSFIYGAVDGLRPVRDPITDGQGFTWLRPVPGDERFLIRFDGKSFRTFENIGSRRGPNELPKWRIMGVNESQIDPNGRFWKCTDQGLFQFKDGEVFRHYSGDHGLPEDMVLSVETTDMGAFALTTGGVVFIPYGKPQMEEPMIVDSIHLLWEFDYEPEDTERLYVLFQSDSRGRLWFALRYQYDMGRPHKLKCFEIKEGSFSTKEYVLEEDFELVRKHPEGVIFTKERRLNFLDQKAKVHPFPEDFGFFLGVDFQGRDHFTRRDGDSSLIIRYEDTDLVEIINENAEISKQFPGYYRVFPGENFGNLIWLYEARTGNRIVIDGDVIGYLHDLYPELGEEENHKYYYPGDGLIWKSRWGGVGIERYSFMMDVDFYEHPNQPDEMHIVGFSPNTRKIYVAPAYEAHRTEDFYELSIDDGRYRPLGIPERIRLDRVSNHIIKFHSTHNTYPNGSFWLDPLEKHRRSSFNFFFDAEDSVLIENPGIAEKLKKTEYYELSPWDNSWYYIKNDSVIASIDLQGHEQEVVMPDGIKLILFTVLKDQEMLIWTNAAILSHKDGQFHDLTQLFGVKEDNTVPVQKNGDLLILQVGSLMAWYQDGKVEFPDTAIYPDLKYPTYIGLDNLNRILVGVSNKNGLPGLSFYMIHEGKYEYLELPVGMELNPVLEYQGDSSLIFFSREATFKYDFKSKRTFRILYQGSRIGYPRSAMVVGDHLLMAGWGPYLMRLDLSAFKLEPPPIKLRGLRVNEEKWDSDSAIVIDYGSHLSLDLYSKDETDFSKVEYQYSYDLEEGKWSNPIVSNRFDFDNLIIGKQHISFRARGKQNVWGDPITIDVQVRAPWFLRIWALIGYGVLLAGLVWLIAWLNGLRLKRRNQELQGMVEERTSELRNKNEQILDSIQYAKRIQQAILPPNKLVLKHLEESFIYYKPKDIVAGDFYWFEVFGDEIFIAAADCTGHGVPGALVSVVCANALHQAVSEIGLREPGLILDKVRELVIETFEKSEEDVKDGMDISFCRVNLKKRELCFAGAHNPVYRVTQQNGELDPKWVTDETHVLMEYKGDKQPIGDFGFAKPFQQHNIKLDPGDLIYMFSDGFADQFGGPKGKKYMYKPFKKLILGLREVPMGEQLSYLDNEFELWRGSEDQVDDVCVIGLKV